MDQATPPWRAFSSDAPAGSASPQPAAPAPLGPRWLIPVLAGVGGLAAGVAVVVAFVLVSGQLVADPAPFPAPASATVVDDPGAAEPEAVELVIDVAGAVVRPGLHRLHAEARVGDAIEAAGGFAPRADLSAASRTLNLARPLADGAKVLVPELGIDRTAGTATRSGDDRIDLNHASSSELETLPGIGPVTAGKIIDAREDERFGAVGELRSRGIVGDRVFEDIERLVHAG